MANKNSKETEIPVIVSVSAVINNKIECFSRPFLLINCDWNLFWDKVAEKWSNIIGIEIKPTDLHIDSISEISMDLYNMLIPGETENLTIKGE